VTDDAELIQDVPVTRAETRTIGRHGVLARRLHSDRITPQQFRERASRLPMVAGYRLLTDPDVMLAILYAVSPEDWIFEYRHGRRGRAS
jgi:hypothetical protein